MQKTILSLLLLIAFLPLHGQKKKSFELNITHYTLYDYGQDTGIYQYDGNGKREGLQVVKNGKDTLMKAMYVDGRMIDFHSYQYWGDLKSVCYCSKTSTTTRELATTEYEGAVCQYGYIDSCISYSTDGKVTEKKYFKEDKVDSFISYFFTNGMPQYAFVDMTTRKSGIGAWWWYPNGVILSIADYKDGQRQSIKYYNSTGKRDSGYDEGKEEVQEIACFTECLEFLPFRNSRSQNLEGLDTSKLDNLNGMYSLHVYYDGKGILQEVKSDKKISKKEQLELNQIFIRRPYKRSPAMIHDRSFNCVVDATLVISKKKR